MKTLLLILASVVGIAQTTFTNGLVPPAVLVSQLPTASSNAYRLFWVSDGASSTDCATGSGSTKVLCGSNGSAWVSIADGVGGGSSVDPATTLSISDDFTNSQSYPSTDGCPCGALGWVNYGETGYLSQPLTGELNHPGIVRSASGSLDTYSAVLYNRAGNYIISGVTGTIDPEETFNETFLVRFNAGADTAVTYNLGLRGNAANASLTHGFYFKKASASTNWTGVCASGSETPTSTVIAVSSSWMAFNVYRKSASTIGFKAASTIAGLASATEQTCTDGTTNALYPFVQLINASAASRSFDVDFYKETIALGGR